MGLSISNNGFERRSRMRGGKYCSCYVVQCSECSAEEVIFFHHHGGLPSEAISAHLRRAGWVEGKNRKRDLCPVHAKKEKPKGATILKHPSAPVGKSFADLKQMQQVPRDITANETEREMTREDGRIIFAKLNEVYLDEKRGYGEDWTDAKVAKELGIPRAWVAKVRDEHFGPAKDNEKWREVKEQAEAMVSELRAEGQKAVAEGAARLKTYNDRADRIERMIRDVEASLK